MAQILVSFVMLFVGTVHVSVVSPERKRELHTAAVNCILRDGLALGVFRQPGMSQFLQIAVPGYAGPNGKTVRQKIAAIYSSYTTKLRSVLSKVDFFALTCDLWRSSKRVHYISLTGHVFTNKYKTVSIVLGCHRVIGRHLSTTIERYIEFELKRLNIKQEQLVSITTDNGSDMKKATSTLKFGDDTSHNDPTDDEFDSDSDDNINFSSLTINDSKLSSIDHYKLLLSVFNLMKKARAGVKFIRNHNGTNEYVIKHVEIVEWERAMRPLDSVQQRLVAQKAIVKPEQRYNEIMDIINKRNFNGDSYLKALNIQVKTEDMLKIQARILPLPQIKYRAQNNQEVVEHVAFGKWKIQNQFRSTSVINKWGMIYFGSKPDNNIIEILKNFEKQLPSLLMRYGIGINSNPLTIAKPSRKDDIDQTFTQVKSQDWQLAIVILNDTVPEVYNYVKKLGNQKIGLITQCASFQAIQRNSEKLHMYVENLSQKLNAKIGGINGIVNLKAALNQASNNDRFMFFGVDVTHTTSSKERPSIAAIVGSCDPTCSRYAVRLCEQYPKKDRCSIEIIKEMDKMVIDLLRVYARSCGNTLPNRIVFYRDGVDDGQFQKVLDNEVKKIKDACRVVYGQNPLPRLTFIIVKKRHNTRFFTYDGQRTDNVEAGTVIDVDITHPSEFDFYLCSQAAIMGTSRPALYHVLHDENGFSSNDIQQLTYWLCHTDARCSKSVSIPAPVHYAHLAAYASHVYEFDHDGDEILEK
ncbi:unnamed protein product [Rotaria sp. Silwood1]|nr:unnamed protein product [Rotaria sp. Silwood1]